MDSRARHRLLSTVDRLLLERGELDPLEYLLAIGGVDYADYREWRHRRRPVLQSALRLPVEEVTAALAHAQAYAIEQRLSVEVCPPTAWDQDQGPLSVGPSRNPGGAVQPSARPTRESPAGGFVPGQRQDHRPGRGQPRAGGTSIRCGAQCTGAAE